jgi:hypothetical protein
MDVMDEVYGQVGAKIKKIAKAPKRAMQVTPRKMAKPEAKDANSDWKFSSEYEQNQPVDEKKSLNTEQNLIGDRTSAEAKLQEDTVKKLLTVNHSNSNIRRAKMGEHHQNSNYNPKQSPPDWQKVMQHAVEKSLPERKQSRKHLVHRRRRAS